MNSDAAVLKSLEEIRSIPKEFSIYKSQRAPQEKHSAALYKMVLDPSIIGINEPVVHLQEYLPPGNIKFPDLVFAGADTCYLAEYKCVNTPYLKDKAKKQLESGADNVPSGFRRNLTKMLYVYEDFQVLELLDGEWKLPDDLFRQENWPMKMR